MTNLHLPELIKYWVSDQNWQEIDLYFRQQTSPDGELFQLLSDYAEFSQMEFIISLRDAANPWEEDGIWHDDGSRVLAFSLSLIDNQDIEGGNLLFRKKGELNFSTIPPFEPGQMVVFKTGTSGYEHKVEAVTHGRRLVVAGWCS